MPHIISAVINNADCSEKPALKLADREAFGLLLGAGAFPSGFTTSAENDKFYSAVARIAGELGIDECRQKMEKILHAERIDHGVVGDAMIDVETCVQHAGYLLGLAVGIRLAAGG